MIARAFLTLQALGEYGAVTGSGASGSSTFLGGASRVVAWVSDHRVAVGVVVALAVLWILLPSRTPR